jgi:hypothetical protein
MVWYTKITGDIGIYLTVMAREEPISDFLKSLELYLGPINNWF